MPHVTLTRKPGRSRVTEPRCNILGEPILNAIYTPEASAQRRYRIRASLGAYAYEYLSRSIISDAEFDELCTKIDPSIATGHPVMDEFFRTEFGADTGMWIHKHPDKEGLEWIIDRYF